jgi:hypothetical protein
MTKAIDLQPGDMLDLEGHPYADPDRDEPSLEFEYAVVLEIELETPGCVLVTTDVVTFGCPPDLDIETQGRVEV